MKPNRSRSGPGSMPGPGGRADEGERRQLQRDRRRPGTLADHDVDPEVLHRDVEHLLGRPGHPVDLVDEEHLALARARTARRPGRRRAGSPGRWSPAAGRRARRRRSSPAWSCRGRAGRRAARGRGRARAPRAASSTSDSWSRTTRWPTNSSSRLGRSAASTARSSASAPASTRDDEAGRRARASLDDRAPEVAQRRRAAARRRRGAVCAPRRDRRRPRRRPAWPTSRGRPAPRRPARARRTAGGGRRGAGRCRTARRAGRSSSSTIRCAPLRPMPGTFDQRGEVLGGDGGAQPVGGVHREHRQGQPRPDAGDRLHRLEGVPLVGVGEAEQGQRVLADHQMGGQARLGADPQPGQGGRRGLQPAGRPRRPRSPPSPAAGPDTRPRTDAITRRSRRPNWCTKDTVARSWPARPGAQAGRRALVFDAAAAASTQRR